MPATVRDVISVNATFVGIELLPTQEAIQDFSKIVDKEVSSSVAAAMAAAVVAGADPGHVAGQSRVLTIDKDRISLTLSSDRSIVQREYPASGDLPILAHVAGAAIDNTDLSSQNARAFGYNIQLVFSQDSESLASTYLTTRLFPANYPRNPGWNLRGGSAKLIYEYDGKLWTANIEPRFNDPGTPHVFFSLNMHIGEPRMPDTSAISEHLESLWEAAISLVQRVDGGGNAT